jgi:hypothetical protein
VVKGTVSISIEDFQALLDSSISAAAIKNSTNKASKEIQVFLSFIHNQLDLTEHIESFNRQSSRSKIVIEDDNRIKIQFNEE